ncbi:MAG: DUF5681 domain-containing protein [Pseudolabrys sp.]|nr:DUF5681 domain-containing protein [Pseudolabrys sp.]MDP2296992.1 DUF5681 domain-containing protein [Pseudolabrys sp.]
MMETEDSTNDQAMSDTENPPLGDYDVGYGKPPRRSQFKKGNSGNPNGRPKVRNDLSGLLAEAFDEQIRTTSGGVEKNVSKTRALMSALLNKALKGDRRALRSWTKLAVRTGNLEPLPDFRDHIPVITMTADEMTQIREHPERRDQLVDQAEEREFKRRAETLERARRAGYR